AIANLTTGIVPIADPLAGLLLPSVERPPVVPSVSVTAKATRMIPPGVYQDVSVSGDGKLTLSAGTYLILAPSSSAGNGRLSGDDGSLSLACASYPAACAPGARGGGVALTGNGTFGLTGNTESCAPTIQADPNNVADIRLTGNGSDTFAGTLYAPSGSLVLTGNGSAFTLAGLIVVGTATVTGNGDIAVDPGAAP